MTESGARRLTGVGLGLRYAFLDDLAERLRAGAPTGLDFVEVCPENYMRRGGDVPATLDSIAEHLPIVTHGLTLSFGSTGDLGAQRAERAYLDELEPFLRRVGTPFHSDHLCLGAHEGGYVHDLLPLPWTGEVVRHAARRIVATRERLGLPIAVENISYYLVPGAPELDEAGFLRAVLEEADASLLLDVNNVFVNAKNFGRDPRELIDALPLERVVEIHVAGHRWSSWAERIIDDHGAPVEDAVLDLLEHALRVTGPVPVLLERDVAVPPLDDLLAEIASIRAVYDRATADFAQPASTRARAVELSGWDDAPSAGLDGHAQSMVDALVTAERSADPNVAVYQRLVRGGLEESIRTQMPLAARLRGEQFVSDVSAFLERGGLPSSPYLRDVPRAFVTFASGRWREDPSVPPHLAELADHEVGEFELAAAADDPNASSTDEAALDVAAPVRLTRASRLARHAHPVHEVTEQTLHAELPARAVNLLSYRDREHAVRMLELTELAAKIFEELAAGAPLGAGIQRAAASASVQLTPEVLADVSQFLADLAERGVLLGALTDERDRMASA